MRYRLVKDNDGHSYLIPADKVEQFNTWVKDTESEEGIEIKGEESFEDCRIPGCPSQITFTDPKED